MEIRERNANIANNVGFANTIKTQDSTFGKGIPKLTLRDRDGNVIQEYTNRNTIVIVGRSKLIKMLTGDSNSRITQCALGTKGVDSTIDPWIPIPPTENDTALYEEVVGSKKNIDSYIYEDGPRPLSVTFTTLFRSEDVDAIVSEAALIFNDETMFARHTFPSMYLKADRGYSLEISWEIQF